MLFMLCSKHYLVCLASHSHSPQDFGLITLLGHWAHPFFFDTFLFCLVLICCHTQQCQGLLLALQSCWLSRDFICWRSNLGCVKTSALPTGYGSVPPLLSSPTLLPLDWGKASSRCLFLVLTSHAFPYSLLTPTSPSFSTCNSQE